MPMSDSLVSTLKTSTTEIFTQSPLVLIADPEVPTAQLLRGVFEHEGYRVQMVHDASRIFDLVASRHPDLIILETRFGNVSGFDILRRLREDPLTASIPTFLLTTSADWPDVLQGLELGADDTMRKPVHPRELLARANSRINARRLEDALQRRTRDLEALLRISEVLNVQHDWRVLPSLILTMVYDLVPSVSAAIMVLHSNPTKDTLSTYPESARTDIKKWINSNRDQVISSTETIELNQPEEKRLQSALVLPLSYLNSSGEQAFLVVFGREPMETSLIQLLEGVGRQANLALQNAELFRLQASYAQQLELKVAERTHELQSAQKQLVQAEKLATVGRLAAGIAHEINNPLMPIKINLESILEDIQSSRAVEEDMVLTTLESVDRIKRLVQRLLEYNAGHATSADAMQPVEINEVVEAVEDLTRKTFMQTGKLIDLDLKPIPPVTGSRDALTQVFINLALNAAEAMEQGGRLTIATRCENDTIKIMFHDTGVGIPPELLDRVFDPFMTTKNGGSGLGLFVSYGIIEGHHGKIDVVSTPRKGTTFTVSLPASSSTGH